MQALPLGSYCGKCENKVKERNRMLVHWIWLTMLDGVGIRGQCELLRLFGSAENIYCLTRQQCENTEGFQRKWLDPVLNKDLSSAQKVMIDCDNQDIRVLPIYDELYPDRLRNIPEPPIVIYYRGTMPRVDEEAAIAIVGTRKCSAYGLLYAKQFSKLIANSGGVVISGGARGIDTMALQGALDSAVPVLCVLGAGIDRPYPQENRWLFREVERHGCLITEYPPGTPPNKGNFPRRNRIMSGLSVGVLVVEAPLGSGALITANFALEQGRDVYTIPGNLGLAQCEGSNELLRDGAQLAINGWDVLQNYQHLFPGKLVDGRNKSALEKLFEARYGMSLPVYSPVFHADPNDKKAVDNQKESTYSMDKEPPTDLSEDEKAVYDLLGDEPQHLDEIVASGSLPSARVMAAMTMLQIKQLAEKQGANYFVRK